MFNGLGPTLRRLREKVAGLTQAEAAARSGIAQSRLSRYENGKKLPDLITLECLLTSYGVNLDGFVRAIKEAQGAPATPASAHRPAPPQPRRPGPRGSRGARHLDEFFPARVLNTR